MSAAPNTYRVYCFDLVRKAVEAQFIKAANDEEAIATVEASDFGSKCEIWHERRMVAQLEGARCQA